MDHGKKFRSRLASSFSGIVHFVMKANSIYRWIAIHLHRRVVNLLLTQPHFTISRIASGAGEKVHIIGCMPPWSSFIQYTNQLLLVER